MKGDGFTVLILVFAADLLVFAVLMLMPIMRRDKAFFGVRVSPEFYLGQGRRLLHRYWLSLAATFVGLGSIGFLTSYYRNNFLYSVVAYLLTYPIVFMLYASFARDVRPFQLASETKKFATPLHTRRLRDYTNVLLEALIGIVTVSPVFVLAYYYPFIPERVPVHWGFNGLPDRWAQKSFSTVFFLPVLAIYLQSWFALLKFDLSHAKMTLPAEHAEVYLRAKEQLIVATMRMMDWIRGLITILLGVVSMFVLFTTIDSLRHWMRIANMTVWPIIGLLLVVSFYYLYRFMSINNALETATGNSNVQRESEAEKWSSGGLFYYNPDDPALIVEKRDGLGFTYNFAGKGIRLRLAFLALVPLIVVWALLDL
jgi:uncharacterized membrane protein